MDNTNEYNLSEVYYGKLYIQEKYNSMLNDYGVISLGGYNKELSCFENCLLSKSIFDKLIKLAHDDILEFDGILINVLKEVKKCLYENKYEGGQ